MADVNGAAANGAAHEEAMRLPTVAELKRAYEEGLPQTLLSGLEVKLRPVQPDVLLAAGNVPEILTPLLMTMLFPKEEQDVRVFPDEENNPITAYLTKARNEAKEALDFVQSVNLVCEAALVEPGIVPYLSIADRMWIFRLAWLPVAVLSTFRLQPQGDVEAGADQRADAQPTEPLAAVGAGA